ncbi:MAG TPA: beta-ketoacyl synthase N-terminal-like domain-containing protein [Archangium sp.]|nr:beta-ketoacyl synthase N-terminal-like domain-containing protein [Archangium sp.]
MTTDINISAMGARTPVGLSAESAAAAVRARISRIAAHPVLMDGAGKPLNCASDPRLELTVQGPDRLATMAVSSLQEVLEKIQREALIEAAVPVYLALPELRPGFKADDAEAISRAIQKIELRGEARLEVELLCEGHAGAIRAIELAMKRMSERACNLCIVGGVDSYLEAETLEWLEADRKVARQGVRDGFIPGEAAGMVALTTRTSRSRLRLPSLATLRGVATEHEARPVDSDEGALGEALSHAIARATRDLATPAERLDHIYCDINGERYRSDEWGFVALRQPRGFRDASAYTSAVSSWGDVGAATAALNCVLAVQAWRRAYARGSMALVFGSSISGLRGAAVLQQKGV